MLTDEELDTALENSPSPARITREHIESRIAKVEFVENPKAGFTICVVHVANGFIVTGTSSCADPANFNTDIGRKISYERVIDQLWPLEGYLLKELMAQQGQAVQATRPKLPPQQDGVWSRKDFSGLDNDFPAIPPFFLATFKDPTALFRHGDIFIGENDLGPESHRMIYWDTSHPLVVCGPIHREAAYDWLPGAVMGSDIPKDILHQLTDALSEFDNLNEAA